GEAEGDLRTRVRRLEVLADRRERPGQRRRGEDRDGAGDAPAGRRCAGAGGRAEVFALVTTPNQPAAHEHGGEPGRDRANPTCTHSPPQLARALCTAAGVARST